MKEIIRKVIIVICFLSIISGFQFVLSAQTKTKIVKIDNLNIIVKVGDSFTLQAKSRLPFLTRK
ncbi:hypothetical protein [Caldicellulosiruptor naganoensis]|uniref:hypothetical protein n=1 Tax=Caldicellulosiruptor naganoensis TaxID=29324 RepID=UPI0005EAEC58|nr:hypothetical protein [Caldicellulosiruptor naganoensis]